MKDNTKLVINYLKANRDKKLTACDVAMAVNLTPRQVNAIFTMALQKQGLGVREDGQIRKDDKYIDVKYLVLTDAGCLINTD